MLVRHTLKPQKKLRDRLLRERAPARIGLAAVFAGVASLSATGAEVSSRPPLGLTVAILDLAEAPDLTPAAPPEPPAPAWRTTFGSERQTLPEPKKVSDNGLLAALADSDAVLIQGVKAPASLRKLFPPRTWRLIVSRRIAASESVTEGEADPANADAVSAELPAATAIAVKVRASLRVTARALALRTNEPMPEEAPVANPPPAPQVAATAVRLVDRGRALWVASVALPPSCGAGTPEPCPAWAELDAWRAAKRGAGETTVIGGRLTAKNPAALAAETPQACLSHRIESDLQSQIMPPTEPIPLSQTGTGCLSIVRVGS
ncbi:hypothetical protein [Hyphomicrobium sp. LHD-15]|uniref:hypothetical protein n=1 Tax=Hyphomicrobium sp. LHD-15 TaxID=3072142 RepID=UPI00281051D3|nr:hypothetical protein [Hyphomicrobium sp. LHD-15]MDQ8700449.1 hypothetical protein [Hyphomicrobium sp. LHD-15]